MSMGVLFTARSNSSVRVVLPGPLGHGDRADGRQHGGRRLLEASVDVDRAAGSNWPCRASALKFTPSTVPPVIAKSDCTPGRCACRLISALAFSTPASERLPSSSSLMSCTSTLSSRRFRSFARFAERGAHRHRAGRSQALRTALQNEILESDRIVRVPCGRFLPLRATPTASCRR